MERILAVIDDRERSLDLLAEMAEVADGVGASLIVLSLLTEEEFDDHAEVMAEIERSEHASFYHSPEDAAADLGELSIEETLDGITYDELLGAVADEGDRANTILTIAEEEGVDHISLVGRRRSPTGKAIFGDAAQGVILNFEGNVTIGMTSN